MKHSPKPEEFLPRGVPIPAELPGFDLHNNCFSGSIDFIPSYEMDRSGMLIDDPVWGEEYIGGQAGDDVLLALADHDAVRRLQAVEQLTLPPFYSIIPNTSGFSRWEHIWGSVVLVRRLARQHGLSDEASLIQQLRTFVSDLGHTAGSHLGDWVFQGVGGTENHHDLELDAYLERVGISDILRRENIEPERVIFPDIQDWVECPSPDLCIDRVDYGVREMRRWVPLSVNMRQFYRQTDATVGVTPDLVVDQPSGRLVMTDLTQAEEFGDAFMALSREHWSDPVNRLQIVLLIERTKRLLIDGHGPSAWSRFYPGDILLCSDHDYQLAFQEHDPFGRTLDIIMQDIARFERTVGWHRRNVQLPARLRGGSSVYMDDYPAHHPMLRIEEMAAGQVASDERGCIAFTLPPLKPRFIDPLVLSPGGHISHVSELSPDYAARLAEHKAQLSRTYVARIAIPDPATERLIRTGLKRNVAEWDMLVRRTRMDPVELRSHIGSAALLTHSLR